VESPRLIRWESLTKKDFDAIDRSRAVVLVTCSDSGTALRET